MYIKNFTERGASVGSLCEAYAAGAPVHAALITGRAGVGKRTLAHTLARSLFCTAAGDRPCGECPGCKRYLAGSHPDAHVLPAQKRIGVDAVRELIAALSAAPYEGGYRTAVIESAGTMTPQAQNSLLKTLEEPPDRTVFLLTAVSAAEMLPTIRSRCRPAPLAALSDEAVEAALAARGLPPDRARTLSRAAQGSLGEALLLDGDAAFWQLQERLLSALSAIRGPGDVLAALDALKDDRPEAARACGMLEGALRGAMAARLEGHAAQGPFAGLDERALLRLMEKRITLSRMLASNVSWQAALERFLLGYTEEITHGNRSRRPV